MARQRDINTQMNEMLPSVDTHNMDVYGNNLPKRIDSENTSSQLMPDNNPFAVYSNINTDKFFGVQSVREREGKESLLQFDNIENGLRAGLYVLRNQYDKYSVYDIANKYSRTDKEGYTNYLIQKLGKTFILDANNNQSVKQLAIAIMGFETGEKDNILNSLNITDEDLDLQIERSKKELADSIYSQMKKII
jgi:hypothetical protein